jgi:hypothetical protein
MFLRAGLLVCLFSRYARSAETLLLSSEVSTVGWTTFPTTITSTTSVETTTVTNSVGTFEMVRLNRLFMISSISWKTAAVCAYAVTLHLGLGCITPKPGDNVWLYPEGTIFETQTSKPLLTTIVRTITSTIPDPPKPSAPAPSSYVPLP